MRCVSCIALLISALTIGGCGGPVSSRAVRDQIASLGGAGLASEDVRVERIVSQTSRQVVAEATVQLAVLLEEAGDGEWEITSVRIGEDEWIDMDTLLSALEERRIEETTANLAMLLDGIEAFEQRNGSLPEVTPAQPLPDLLHPQFVPTLVRQDSWGSDFIYEPSAEAVRLLSPGPDRQRGTVDDIEVSSDRGL